jgi:hypothetical protein
MWIHAFTISDFGLADLFLIRWFPEYVDAPYKCDCRPVFEEHLVRDSKA